MLVNKDRRRPVHVHFRYGIAHLMHYAVSKMHYATKNMTSKEVYNLKHRVPLALMSLVVTKEVGHRYQNFFPTSFQDTFAKS